MRSDGYNRANATGFGFDLNTKGDKYNFEGDAAISLVNEVVDSPGITLTKGYRWQLEVDKIVGRFRFGFESGGITDDFDINDLGISFRTNYLWHNATVNYNINDPFGRFLNFGNWAGIFLRQDIPTGEIAKLTINTNHWFTLKESYFNMWFGMDISPYRLIDHYEAREEGRKYLEYTWGGIYVGVFN